MLKVMTAIILVIFVLILAGADTTATFYVFTMEFSMQSCRCINFLSIPRLHPVQCEFTYTQGHGEIVSNSKAVLPRLKMNLGLCQRRWSKVPILGMSYC